LWRAVMYELKNRCFPSDRLKWFHSTLEEHITKKSPGIKTSMDMIPKPKEQFYWHRCNDEWRSCMNSKICVFQETDRSGSIQC
jgi:hypothetical protein